MLFKDSDSIASSRGNIDEDTSSSENGAIAIVSILILVGIICFVAASIVVHRRRATAQNATTDAEAISDQADQEVKLLN